MERTDFSKNTFPFSVAIFNCIVNAVLVFFFPITMETKWWLKMIVCFLTLFSLSSIHYKDELKQERQNNPSFPTEKKLAYYTIYLAEIIYFITVLLVMVSPYFYQQSVEGALAKNWNDPDTWQKIGDSIVYIMLALIPFSSCFLFHLAGLQGKRSGFFLAYTLVVMALIAVPYYLEMREPGVQLPKYIQSICFLLNIPYLFRLRQLESYSHLVS